MASIVEKLTAIDPALGGWAADQIAFGRDEEYIMAFLRVAIVDLEAKKAQQPRRATAAPRPKPSDASIARAVARMAKDVIKASK